MSIVPSDRAQRVPSARRSAERRRLVERRLPGLDPTRLVDLRLTRREVAVLEQLARGRTNDEAAAALALSPLTVKKHVERMCARLNVRNRTALVALVWHRSRP